jgi:hypothetical protein
MIRGDDYDVIGPGQRASVVSPVGAPTARSSRKSAAVRVEHNRAFLPVIDARCPYVEELAILTRRRNGSIWRRIRIPILNRLRPVFNGLANGLPGLDLRRRLKPIRPVRRTRIRYALEYQDTVFVHPFELAMTGFDNR